LSYIVDFREDDFLTNKLNNYIYTEADYTNSFVSLHNTQFNFKSNYFSIMGTNTMLRLLMLPLALFFVLKVGIFKTKSSYNQKNNNAQFKEDISLFKKILVKILSSLYIMTQFESFTYMVTSMRGKPNIYDITALGFNFLVLTLS
jgi:hypothetical protein